MKHCELGLIPWHNVRNGNRGMENTTQRGALRSVLLTKYYSGDQVQKNRMGKVCGTYGRQEISIQGFGGIPEGKTQV
jgi:hypothetical protein